MAYGDSSEPFWLSLPCISHLSKTSVAARRNFLSCVSRFHRRSESVPYGDFLSGSGLAKEIQLRVQFRAARERRPLRTIADGPSPPWSATKISHSIAAVGEKLLDIEYVALRSQSRRCNCKVRSGRARTRRR